MMGALGSRLVHTLVPAAVGAGTAAAAWSVHANPPGGPERWERTNHRGETVTMVEGPAWALGAGLALLSAPMLPVRVRAGAVLATLGAAVFGAVDDLVENGASKGLRGHLGSLGRGEVTTGALKVLGIGATGAAAAAVLLPPRHGAGRLSHLGDVAVAGGVIAGAANLANLLDLRPGRVLKLVLALAPTVLDPGRGGTLRAAALGATLPLLIPDLCERAMLGDCGANAVGALLGADLVHATTSGTGGRPARAVAFVAIVALTLASERVSFTRVIESTPGLRTLDALGRRRPASSR